MNGRVWKTNVNERECYMFEKEKRKKKLKKVKTADIETYLKKLPPPPEEHTYELKMEKRLRRALEEQGKKTKNT